MPRKNHRFVEDQRTLPERTSLVVADDGWMPEYEARRLELEQGERMRRRTHERRMKRLKEAITDWDICLVPGCGERSWTAASRIREPDVVLPMCNEHETVVWAMVERYNHSSVVHLIYGQIVARRDERERRDRTKEQRDYLASTDGQIYVLRQNGLIKVGWSRSLSQRLGCASLRRLSGGRDPVAR